MSASFYDSSCLESDQSARWKDSFDKLADDRPHLRAKRILKRNIRASFNRDSSVEESETSIVVEPSIEKQSTQAVISTPNPNHLKLKRNAVDTNIHWPISPMQHKSNPILNESRELLPINDSDIRKFRRFWETTQIYNERQLKYKAENIVTIHSTTINNSTVDGYLGNSSIAHKYPTRKSARKLQYLNNKENVPKLDGNVGRRGPSTLNSIHSIIDSNSVIDSILTSNNIKHRTRSVMAKLKLSSLSNQEKNSNGINRNIAQKKLSKSAPTMRLENKSIEQSVSVFSNSLEPNSISNIFAQTNDPSKMDNTSFDRFLQLKQFSDRLDYEKNQIFSMCSNNTGPISFHNQQSIIDGEQPISIHYISDSSIDSIIVLDDSELPMTKSAKQTNVVVLDSIAEMTAESIAEMTGESIAEKTGESIDEMIGESIAEKTSESIAEKTGESIAEMIGESIAEMTDESIAEMIGESIAEKTGESTENNSNISHDNNSQCTNNFLRTCTESMNSNSQEISCESIEQQSSNGNQSNRKRTHNSFEGNSTDSYKYNLRSYSKIEPQANKSLSSTNLDRGNESTTISIEQQNSRSAITTAVNLLAERSNNKSINFRNTITKRRKILMEHNNSINSPKEYQEKISEKDDYIILQSGKWRRSIAYWRKTNIPMNSHIEEIHVDTNYTKSTTVFSEENFWGAELSIESFRCPKNVSSIQNQQKQQQQQQQHHRRTTFAGPTDCQFIRDTDAKDNVLRCCGQTCPLNFEDIYCESTLRHCRKIGEGVYGEVFMNKTSTGQAIVSKIIPIEGAIEINGEPQKKFNEILPEIIISLKLSALRNGSEWSTSGFVEVKQIRCVQGRYPAYLLELWELYKDNYGTENDCPDVFLDDQLYIVLELANAGQDLEAFQFTNAVQAQSALQQIVLTLAVAERQYKFEHRDLHWGNILLAPTDEKEILFKLNHRQISIPTNGVKATIIDYTLSRMNCDNCVYYNDLSHDDGLFVAGGDYQFDIYRIMRNRLDNQWDSYEPYTNVLWLHYIVDKLINGAQYKYTKTRKHRAAIHELMIARDNLLEYQSAHEKATSI